ncbi:hypothetical protein E2C01_093838 [Portunus trituberculatus]|uniref:Uncharacterized protein n=1 Tax=Portunus trituberculatus TaxID=210409 RepID=A0A5B7JZ80_PORTR|nr:hypothetical protein [Portunus trituberculatus]
MTDWLADRCLRDEVASCLRQRMRQDRRDHKNTNGRHLEVPLPTQREEVPRRSVGGGVPGQGVAPNGTRKTYCRGAFVEVRLSELSRSYLVVRKRNKLINWIKICQTGSRSRHKTD